MYPIKAFGLKFFKKDESQMEFEIVKNENKDIYYDSYTSGQISFFFWEEEMTSFFHSISPPKDNKFSSH